MPGYATVKETIFTGITGRELRRHPAEVRELQFWLVTGPDRDPYGIWIFEPEAVSARIGRTVASIRKSLDTLVDLGFCQWDPVTQFVWVLEMAHHQFNTPLKAADYRCAAARKWYASAPRNPFLGPWWDRYVEDFHLEKDPNPATRRDYERRGHPRGMEGAGTAPNNAMSDLQGFDLLGEKPRSGQLVDPDAPLVGPALEAAFTRLWTAYPNAVEKKQARAMFARLKPNPPLVDTMLAAIEHAKRGRRWREGYIPKLANWLEKHRWMDKIEEMPAVTERTARTMGAAERFVQRRATGPASTN